MALVQCPECQNPISTIASTCPNCGALVATDRFDEIERKLIEQADQYREQHLSAKLSLYSGFFAFDGLTLAAAGLFSTRSHTYLAVLVVLGLSLASCVILFVQYRWLLTFYDRMGYTKISIQSDQDIADYYKRTESDRVYFQKLRKPRRLFDTLLFVFAFAQIILIGYAALQMIPSSR